VRSRDTLTVLKQALLEFDRAGPDCAHPRPYHDFARPGNFRSKIEHESGDYKRAARLRKRAVRIVKNLNAPSLQICGEDGIVYMSLPIGV
jgi:hypothetical protein